LRQRRSYSELRDQPKIQKCTLKVKIRRHCSENTGRLSLHCAVNLSAARKPEADNHFADFLSGRSLFHQSLIKLSL
jgi:hypothetical protein